MPEGKKANKKERKKALIIGVAKYRSLPSLKFCMKDAEDMYKCLTSSPIEFEIEHDHNHNHKLAGAVPKEEMRKAITNFFDDITIKPKDTLLFYFSGHGVIESNGDGYFGTYEIDPDRPYDMGIPFSYLTDMMGRSTSKKIVTILDCCYSGAASLGGKGVDNEDDQARLGTHTINTRIKSGEGKYLLSASQGYQEAFSTQEGDNSIFTHYLLEGLRGSKGESIDKDGNISPYSLGNYVYNQIMSLPSGKRPKQKPVTKVQASGDVILAHYPDKVRREIPSYRSVNGMILDLLAQGKIAEINKIRQEDPYRTLDLHRANLIGAKLGGVNLSGANLSVVDLIEADLFEANLNEANLKSARLMGADLSEANLGGANLEGADLRGANLFEANLGGANLSQANLGGAKLFLAMCQRADLWMAYLVGANLGGANLKSARLVGANLEGAMLEGADLEGADLLGTKLGGAKLGGAPMRAAMNLPITDEEARSRGAILN